MQNSGEKSIGLPNTLNIMSRTCDSRNLNLSPLCDLTSTVEPVKWGKDVKEQYENTDVPDYIQTLGSPMRNTYYTKAMKDNEMLKTLTKVHD
jgi:hypothetical protein